MPGRAYVIGGDIYYSPNCKRDVQLPGELLEDDIKFFNNVGVEKFEEPYWWSPRIPWLGFVPRRPVCWNGALVEDVGYMPRHLLVNSEGSQRMLPFLSQNRWLAVETLIREVLGILSRRFNIDYLEPYSTRKWGYTNGHPSEGETWHHAHQGCDWFAMWIALLYWMLKMVPEDPKYLEGISPTEWYKILVMWDKSRISVWESLRCAPLLQRFWDANRAGVFLHNPDDQPLQLSPSWLDHCGVPVWYRWGCREIAQSQDVNFPLMTPPPEVLQAATTVISTSPFSSTHNTENEWDHMLSNEYQYTPASPSPFTAVDPAPISPSSPPPSSPFQLSKVVWKGGRLQSIVKSGKSIWGPFLRDHEERHEKMLLKESPAARQSRLNREREPPTASAAVYVWDWNLDTPPKFTRTLVPKRDRGETLEDARPGEARYDAFCNEWNVCDEWVNDTYEASDDEEGQVSSNAPTAGDRELASAERPQSSTTIFSNAPLITSSSACPSPSTTGSTNPPPSSSLRNVMVPVPVDEKERSRLEVLDILTKFYGFIPPHGLSMQEGLLAPLADIRVLLTITSTALVKINSALWATPMGKACIKFALHLDDKEKKDPPATIWDLAPNSPSPLKFCRRLRFIKRVRGTKTNLYMFDFGGLSTATWCIAVYTAAAALMICRLPETFNEQDIAVELVLSGVPFRTLSRRIGLSVLRDDLPCSMIPMVFSDHVFTRNDYDFWKQRCESILLSQRGRAAVLRGGYVRRLALAEGVGVSEALKGPSGLHQNPALNFCVWDKDGIEYVDDDLTADELDLLCGIYQSFPGPGTNIKKQSWFPLVTTFEGSGADQGRWHTRLDCQFKEREASIINRDRIDSSLLLTATQWRRQMRGFGESRRATASVEKWSTDFINTYCG